MFSEPDLRLVRELEQQLAMRLCVVDHPQQVFDHGYMPDSRQPQRWLVDPSLLHSYMSQPLDTLHHVPVPIYAAVLKNVFKKAKKLEEANCFQEAWANYFLFTMVTKDCLTRHVDYPNPAFAAIKNSIRKKRHEALTKSKLILPILYQNYKDAVLLGRDVTANVPTSITQNPSKHIAHQTSNGGYNDNYDNESLFPDCDGHQVIVNQHVTSSFASQPNLQTLLPHTQMPCVGEGLPQIQSTSSSSTEQLASFNPHYHHQTQSLQPPPQQTTHVSAIPYKPPPPQLPPRPSVNPPPHRDYLQHQNGAPLIPPKPAEYENLGAAISDSETNDAPGVSSPPNEGTSSSHHQQQQQRATPRSITISSNIVDLFTSIAESNTRVNLETCAIICGTQTDDGNYHATTLIIPKQQATSDSCTTENEEEITNTLDRWKLISLGWIHTHPTQSCFMSSLDLHTHCSYQLMLPEAIAIVCAPKSNPRWGIFRLTEPYGIDFIRECREESSFHPHQSTAPLYTDAYPNGHVIMYNYNLHTIDLRERH
ncbi:hypothetical protein EV182_000393 [Spiromyces aspiralis]|uniref:Uncharacterized protein n=1 Tax=Spiromyces aspiralis TaxID=68401 RepID=A0ACC1HKL1_9FUNG|nr:hypothetical protein EV182_000393 [Spiromyces aspiralis]